MTCVVALFLLVGTAWAGQPCGPPVQFKQLRYDHGNIFYEKTLRNQRQCFNLCWSTNPCVAVNFDTKTRSCFLLSKRAARKSDLSIDFHVVYGEVHMATCKPFSSPCDRRPCRKHATCVSFNYRFQCIRTKPPAVRCPDPPELEHAKATVHKGRKSVVAYNCIDGYRFHGTRNVHTCTRYRGNKGRWEGLQGKCVRKRCGVPPDVPEADIDNKTDFLGIVRTYKCRYNNQITASITCQKNETWSEVELQCPVDCGPPPTINGSTLTPGETVEGSVRYYTCPKGMVASGEMDIHCLANKTWTTVNFTCRVDCGKPHSVANASMTYVTPSMVEYMCIEGFNGSGHKSSTCESDGNWSGVTFSCLLVDCGKPKTIEHAKMSITSTAVNSSVFYDCALGYTGVGMSSVTCQSNGSWSESAFICNPVECTQPPEIANVMPLNGSWFFKDTVQLFCKENSFAVGLNIATCNERGQWDTGNFMCREQEPRVLVAVKETREFHTIEMHSRKTKKLSFKGEDSIQDVDYCPKNGTLYWVEPDVIRVASLDGDSPREIWRENGTGGFVRVDCKSDLLFFAVRGKMTSLKKLNLSDNSVTLMTTVDTPLALEIDPDNSRVYWAEWVSTKKVMRMSYDGSINESVVELGPCDLGPWAVHIDQNKRLYWSVNDEVHVRDAEDKGNGTLLHNFKSICDGIRTFGEQTFVSCTNDSTVRVHVNGTEQKPLHLNDDITGEKFITIIP